MAYSKTHLQDELVQNIVTRQLMYDFLQSVAQSSSPLDSGEKFVVCGSSIPMLYGVEHPEVAPQHKMASDLDLSLYETAQRSPSYNDRNAKFLSHKNFFVSAANAVGAQCEFNDREHYEGDCEARISKTLSASTLKDLLLQPHNHKMLTNFLRRETIDQLIQRISNKDYKVSFSLHYNMFPISVVPPVKRSFSLGNGEGEHLMMGNPNDFIGLKLARLLVPPDKIGGYLSPIRGYKKYEKASDFIDVADMMRMLEHHGQSADHRLCRLAAVFKMGTLGKRDAALEGVTIQRLDPDHSEFTLDGGDALDIRPRNIQRFAYEMHRDRISPREISTPAAWLREAMNKCMTLTKSLFPESSDAKTITLTQAEQKLLVASTKLPGDTGLQQLQEALELLKNDYCDVFERNPDLEKCLHSYFLPLPEISPEQIRRWDRHDDPSQLFLG